MSFLTERWRFDTLLWKDMKAYCYLPSESNLFLILLTDKNWKKGGFVKSIVVYHGLGDLLVCFSKDFTSGTTATEHQLTFQQPYNHSQDLGDFAQKWWWDRDQYLIFFRSLIMALLIKIPQDVALLLWFTFSERELATGASTCLYTIVTPTSLVTVPVWGFH